ncbi:MAG: LptM family lipoprotein [Sporomusa sp.]
MKKVLAIMLAMVLCFGLAACGSSSDSGTSDSGTSDSGTSDSGTSDSGTSDSGTSDSVADSEAPSEENVENADTVEDDESTGTSTQVTQYDSGTYKIGVDMPAGEYLITSSGSGSISSYIEVASDSTGNLDSIVMNDNFYNRIYVTVEDGQYLQFTGIAIAADDAESFSPTDGNYPSGMYKVGKDISAGEYKISLEDGGTLGYGYFEVTSDSSGSLYSIATNDNIQGDKYQTVSDGQYIKLSGCFIQA